ncbi:hypothetical protein IPM62_05975 [Candidatus Woesebacteria bacterium]|nr:MAG: hypothetical protein IPM62_05975 [Candidatus Woesebacteria bacterium]
MKVKKEVEVYIDPFNDDPYNLEWATENDFKPKATDEPFLFLIKLFWSGVYIVSGVIAFLVFYGLIDLAIYTVTGFSVIDFVMGKLNLL